MKVSTVCQKNSNKIFQDENSFDLKKIKTFEMNGKLEYISLQKSEVSQEKNISSFNYFIFF